MMYFDILLAVLAQSSGLNSGDSALVVALLGLVGTATMAFLVYKGKKVEVEVAQDGNLSKQEQALRDSLYKMNQDLQARDDVRDAQVDALKEEVSTLKASLAEITLDKTIVTRERDTLLIRVSDLEKQVHDLKDDMALLVRKGHREGGKRT